MFYCVKHGWTNNTKPCIECGNTNGSICGEAYHEHLAKEKAREVWKEKSEHAERERDRCIEIVRNTTADSVMGLQTFENRFSGLVIEHLKIMSDEITRRIKGDE